MTENIKSFLEQDNAKLEQLIEDYPKQIPCSAVAEYLGSSPDSVRAMADNGFLGTSWRKPGKLTGGNCIPTAKFVRWALNMRV